MAKRTIERDEPPYSKKRPKRDCHFDKAWIQEFQGIGVSSKGAGYARCTLCCSDFTINHGGRNDVTTHVKGKHHKEMATASSSSRSITSMFNPKVSESAIKAEALWAMFIAKHNIPFLASDHANKLFTNMFPDSELAKQFSCGRTKTTAIVTQALAPHFLNKVTSELSLNGPFSILMDESNDKTDKSCIILVRVFDSSMGDCCTRFLDMPIVNIGTAVNLFTALKTSLESKGYNFSKAVAFMSDTTNVMKGARSGVQKRIKNEHPHLYDVSCICHLANLTVKAGLKALPVDIDQLLIDVFYYFYYSSRRK